MVEEVLCNILIPPTNQAKAGKYNKCIFLNERKIVYKSLSGNISIPTPTISHYKYFSILKNKKWWVLLMKIGIAEVGKCNLK